MLSPIRRGVQKKDSRIRVGALTSLRVSSGVIPTLDPILERLYDESPYVRREAVKTLGRIGNSLIVPYIIQATKDQDAGVRIRAITALGKICEREEVIPVISRCMNDPNSAVRVRAREELEKLRGESN